MHVNATYESMHEKQINEDIIIKINQYFSEKILELNKCGIKDVILDPGFGFGKTIGQQFQLIDELQHISFCKFPLLAGVSRKSFIYRSLEKSPLEINEETQNLHRKVLEKGAKILRVHDVKETKMMLRSL